MFINRIPIIMTTSRERHEKNTLVTSIEQVIQAYQSRGFKIQAILGDIQQIIEEKGISINICAANEHLPEIERYIRTVKERMRRIAVPFERYPPQLIIVMVYNCVFWLNSYPHKDSIHPTLSPRTIMTGQKITRQTLQSVNSAHR